MEHVKSFVREFKVVGVTMFIFATVWACAWSRRFEQQSNSIQYWPPTKPFAQPAVEVTSASPESDLFE